ncbi:MAG TPA: protein kinase [Gammaproteobacteria bacterium]
MPLTSGARFGAYEIAESIGAGGMGEVYRATDKNLKRDVAIKILPEAFAANADRLARFQREAEVLAALNHPNIAHIYGLERADGATALVMELVEGPTLADRIAQGPIPADEALAIATQIAAALEAAHERGIIHRDLKPANVKLRPDGAVKVLDFGIAKALDTRVTSGPQAPQLTTPAMTQAGIILGTAAYMAPEQARGKAIDQRADIWAFGCVLYEMLTGQPAFGGEDVLVTLARVLDRDTNMNSLPAMISPAVRHTIKLCLEKDPKKRLHAIGDVRLALEGRFESELPRASASAAPRALWSRVWPLAATAVLAGVIVGATLLSVLRPEPGALRRFAYTVPGDVVFRNTGRPVLAVSPDGRHFAYNTTRGIFLRSMDELEARLIPGTEEGLRGPFFSPDGQSIVYVAPGDALKRISITGGAPVVIGDTPNNSQIGAVWANDSILFGAADGVYRVAATGGVPELVIARDSAQSQVYVGALLPDEDSLLVTERSTAGGNWDAAEIAVYSLSTGERTLLIAGGAGATYLPTGHLVYALGDTLFGVAFDAETLTLSGGPVPLVQGVLRAENNTGAANFGVSTDGTLVYVRGDAATFKNTLVWVDRDGREESIRVPPRNYIYAQLSPDGTRVVLDSRDEENDIWTFDLARATLQRLTFDPGLNRSPVWSPDGRRVAFTRELDSGEAAYWQAADGTGTAERLTGDQNAISAVTFPSAFLPDGSGLLYSIGTNDVGMVSIGGTSVEAVVITGDGQQNNPTVSPDGRWVAYQSNESDRFEVYVRSFPDINAGRWQISTDGGTRPEWSADGKELFYFKEDAGSGAELVAVNVELGETFRPGTQQTLFSGRYLAGQALRGVYDVTEDGQRFLLIKRVEGERDSVERTIVIVENWFEEVKRLVPTE